MNNEFLKMISVKCVFNFLAIKLYKYKGSFIRFIILTYSE